MNLSLIIDCVVLTCNFLIGLAITKKDNFMEISKTIDRYRYGLGVKKDAKKEHALSKKLFFITIFRVLLFFLGLVIFFKFSCLFTECLYCLIKYIRMHSY